MKKLLTIVAVFLTVFGGFSWVYSLFYPSYSSFGSSYGCGFVVLGSLYLMWEGFNKGIKKWREEKNEKN